ncbi:MAG: TonB-dependent receptor [Candidatus Marinimicrobia bacterium]|nr:TonB-dependent receptor [Candidatus Neomarinimicrobiota bacterium]
MKSSKYITIFMWSILSILSAQRHGGGYGGAGGCEIYGTIVDSSTTLPIEYASISLINRENELITGGVTSSDGKFHIKEIQPGKYLVKIEFMGFKTVSIEDVKLNYRGNPKKDLGQIGIASAALEINAITVIDDRPIFEFETDKLIYNSSDDIIADSGTAEDVLNKVPMVVVDQDGEVTLRGNPNVKILVNGRPNRTGEGGNDVDNIPASLIDKVEVITSPSAKYDPDGMAGIINIVLKKGKYEGLNGSIKINGKHNTYASVGEMNGFTTYGNYKGEKWNLYSSLSLNNRQRNMNGYRRVDTEYDSTEVLPKIIESIHYDFTNESDRVGYSVKFGADYSITDQLIVNGEVNYNVHLRNGVNVQNNTKPDISSRITKDNDLDDNYNLEGFFEINKSFDNPDRELIFSASSNFKKDNGYKILQQDSTFLEQDISERELDFSYKHPLNENSKLEFGYDGKFTDNNEIMNFEHTKDFDIFSGENTFGYKRNLHGLFFELDYKLNDKFSIKPSIRYEYVYKNISFNSTILESADFSIIYADILYEMNDSVFVSDYHTYYPNLHFAYNITEKQSLQFGMSKRVNRPGEGGHGPGSRQIRPFPRDVYSENFIFMGNPFLKPEYSTQYELSFKSPIPMGFAYVNAYYHQLEDVIEWYDDDRYDNADVLTFRNAASGENFGIEFFTMIMGQTLGGGYSLSKLDDPTGDYELNGNSQHFRLYNRINLPEKYIKYFDFEFGFFYMKMTVPGGDLFGAKGTMWANTGISKSFMDDRFSVSLGINNLFDAGGFQMKREKQLYPSEDGDPDTIDTFENGYIFANELTDVSTSRHGRTFTINIKYHFGKMQEEKSKGSRGMGQNDGGGMDMGF